LFPCMVCGVEYQYIQSGDPDSFRWPALLLLLIY
jgi:hypothetical protein